MTFSLPYGRALGLAVAFGLGAGCVTTGTYNAKVAELQTTRRDAAAREQDLATQIETARVQIDSGRTLVKPDAGATLKEVAQVIGEIKDRRFLIVGHTDDVPIHT